MLNQEICRFIEKKEYNSAEDLVGLLLEISKEDIRDYIRSMNIQDIAPKNVPQYSSISDGTIGMISYLRKSGNFGPDFDEVGKHFLGINHNEAAYKKYGENHSKLAELLGVVDIRNEGRRKVYLNDLGIEIEKLNVEEQEDCFDKLACRIPVVQYAIQNDIYDGNEVEILLQHYLAETTAKRRRKNTLDLILRLRGE